MAGFIDDVMFEIGVGLLVAIVVATIPRLPKDTRMNEFQKQAKNKNKQRIKTKTIAAYHQPTIHLWTDGRTNRHPGRCMHVRCVCSKHAIFCNIIT